MTIWILAVLLLASLAALGLRQGAIRVAFSFIGILLGALLALPLGHLLKPLLSVVHVRNPLLLAALPPCVVFLVVLTVFKAAALVVHRKAEVYYKYTAGDLRQALWDRLNHRLGLCLGLLNGTAYLVIASTAIYTLSYWTCQMATPESAPRGIRLVNRLGKDLENTGMVRVAGALNRMPVAYYDAADVVGLLYHTPALEPRLSRYPAVLGLTERPEFQDLLSDSSFTNLWAQQSSLLDILKHPRTQAILNNPAQLKEVTDALLPNLRDLRVYLETGLSTNFDAEQILGRWLFDVNGAVAVQRRAKPNMSPTEASRLRLALATGFARTVLVATPEQDAILKNIPQVKVTAGAAPTTELQTVRGKWKNTGGKYELTIGDQPQAVAVEIQGERLNIPAMGLAFIRDE